MGAVLQFQAALEHMTCWGDGCGIEFAAPRTFLNSIRERGGSLYCPRGCHLGLGKSEVTKLKEQLEAKDRALAWSKESLEAAHKEREHAEHRAAALKGVVTKTKKRIGHGVCPCCTRSFQNLRRHMTAKHPDYAGEEVAS